MAYQLVFPQSAASALELVSKYVSGERSIVGDDEASLRYSGRQNIVSACCQKIRCYNKKLLVVADGNSRLMEQVHHKRFPCARGLHSDSRYPECVPASLKISGADPFELSSSELDRYDAVVEREHFVHASVSQGTAGKVGAKTAKGIVKSYLSAADRFSQRIGKEIPKW